MRGIERTFGVSRRTVSAWLKEQANDPLPLEETLQPVDSKKIPVLDGDELRSSVFRSKDKVWVWIAMNGESREIVASACGDRSENTCRILWDCVPSACIAYHLLVKKPSFSVIIGARIKPSFRPSNIALRVKKRGKQLIIHRYNTELLPIVG